MASVSVVKTGETLAEAGGAKAGYLLVGMASAVREAAVGVHSLLRLTGLCLSVLMESGPYVSRRLVAESPSSSSGYCRREREREKTGVDGEK